MNKQGVKKIAVMLLSVMMVFTMMPAFAFAEDTPSDEPAVEDVVIDETVQGEDENAEPASGEETVVEEPEQEAPAPEAEPQRDSEPDTAAPAAQPQRVQQQAAPKKAASAQTQTDADEGGEDQGQDEEPACAHLNMQRVLKKDATCMKTGNKEYYLCRTCGGMFLDPAGKKPTTKAGVNIPINPKAHKLDGGRITTKPAAGKAGVKTYTCTHGCGYKKTEAIPYVARNVNLDGKNLQFKSNVAVPVPKYMAKIDHVWIKAAKKSIAVNWNNPKNMKYVGGVIILRKAGKETAFREVARFNFKSGGARRSFVDNSANKKNTPYTYIAVTYYVEKGYTYISHVSDWAAGQTSASKKKSAYTATINKKTASLQYGGGIQLKVKYKKAKKTYNAKSFRWYSDNKKVATVNNKGKVTATGPGTTYIRCRLSSGNDVLCKVTVAGAFKPATPTLKVDIADQSSITLVWTKSAKANNYVLYQSTDGKNWNKSYNVKTTSKKVTGLAKGKLYYFYVVAQNVNGPYKANSGKSKVVSQKAVIKLRPTSVSGFPSKKSVKVGSTIKLSLKVTAPEKRAANLQMKSNGKWVNKKTVTLPKGTGNASFTLTFPKDWENGKTEWRLYIPKSNTASEYKTGTLTITAQRAYQNPSSYVQVQDSISKHGYSHYVSPILVSNKSSKSDHIDALIKTAKKYKGAAYVQSRSGAAGNGIDESGLVIQACYGAGVDLWPISPSSRPYNCVPKIMDSKLKKITYKAAAEGSNDYPGTLRGDLIFFSENGSSTPTVVAIYTGLGDLIFADKVKGSVSTSTIRTLTDPDGKYKYKVVAVRRIFN